MGSNFFKVDKL